MSQPADGRRGVRHAAASLSLYPVVDGWHWFWDGIGAVTVVAVVGALTRLRAAAGRAVRRWPGWPRCCCT